MSNYLRCLRVLKLLVDGTLSQEGVTTEDIKYCENCSRATVFRIIQVLRDGYHYDIESVSNTFVLRGYSDKKLYQMGKELEKKIRDEAEKSRKLL